MMVSRDLRLVLVREGKYRFMEYISGQNWHGGAIYLTQKQWKERTSDTLAFYVFVDPDHLEMAGRVFGLVERFCATYLPVVNFNHTDPVTHGGTKILFSEYTFQFEGKVKVDAIGEFVKRLADILSILNVALPAFDALVHNLDQENL